MDTVSSSFVMITCYLKNNKFYANHKKNAMISYLTITFGK